eukprot:gene25941-11620_t
METNELLHAAGAWSQKAKQRNLIIAAPSPKQSSIPTHQVGVSVQYLVYIANSLDASITTTTSFVSKAISPITAKPPWNKKARFFDMVPPQYIGAPDHYLVYAWQTPLKFIVEQIESRLWTEELTALERADKLKNTYIWIDWVAVNQHTTNAIELSHIRACVSSVSVGCVVVFDSKLNLLSRAWCLYEMWCFVYYGSFGKISLLLPPDVNANTLVKFDDIIDQLNLSRTTSTRHADVTRIASEVREFGYLQQVLSCIPEIGDDDKVLTEIREIFKAYDTDGSGSLDEDEFVEVLMLSGFGEDESHKIFKEVDADGEGGVDMGEFETWWLLTQRQDKGTRTVNIVYRADALVTNLTKFHAVLERNELEEEARLLDSHLSKMKEGKVFERQNAPLVPTPLRGE